MLTQPAYRLHRRSGQAVVSLPLGGGKYRDFYLGAHGTPESRAEYDRVIAEWLANARRVADGPPSDLTVAGLAAAYLDYAKGYYQRTDPLTGERRPSNHIERIKTALAPAAALYGATLASKFGPLALKACRQQWIDRKLSRTHVNQLVDSLRRAFKWAASEELVSAAVYESLRTVRGLTAGRSAAREPKRVLPAVEADVLAVQGVVLPQVRDLIELQLLTACRPGEAVMIRPVDLDQSGNVWTYRPPVHKTQHHGHARTIYLGPRAQRLLAPYLVGRDPSYPIFSATEAVRSLLASQGRKVRLRRRLTSWEGYRVDTYRVAVAKGCKKAGVKPWHPHQLRHLAATRLCAEFGWDTARMILGHRTINVTRIYAEDDLAKAAQVVGKVG